MPTPTTILASSASSILTETEILDRLNSITSTVNYNGRWITLPRIIFDASGTTTVERVWEFEADGVTRSSVHLANLVARVGEALPGYTIASRDTTPEDMAQTSGGRVLVMFSTRETSTAQVNAPTAADIQAGFTKYTTHYTNTEKGRWVGVSPRVVRQARPASNVTHAAWLYEFPDTPWVRANLSRLITGIARGVTWGLREETLRFGPSVLGLLGMGTREERPADWDQVLETPYNEALNGSYQFWSCALPLVWGCAAVTRTTNEFPGVASTEYLENPVGPDTALTHPGESDLISLVKTVTVAAVVVAGLWFVGGPIVSAVTARKNPHGAVDRFERWQRMSKTARRKAIREMHVGDLRSVLSALDRNGDFDDMDHDDAAELLTEMVERDA